MIEINLLPAYYKVNGRIKGKKTKIAPEKEAVFLVLVGIGSFLLFATIGYTFFQKIELKKEQKTLAKTEKQIKDRDFFYNRVNSAKKEIATIKPELAILDALVKKRKLWSRKMNQISWLLPEKVWLTKVEVQEKEEVVKRKVGAKVISEKVSNAILTIKGSAVSLKGEERLQAIANFMAILKGNQHFFTNYFQNLKFVTCSSRKIGSFEVMDFTFELPLKANGKD